MSPQPVVWYIRTKSNPTGGWRASTMLRYWYTIWYRIKLYTNQQITGSGTQVVAIKIADYT